MNLWTLTARTLGIDPNTTNAAEVEQIEEGVRNIQKEMILTNLPLAVVAVFASVSLALNVWQIFSTNDAIRSEIAGVQSALNGRISDNASADIANKAELASKITTATDAINTVASDLKKLDDSLPPSSNLVDVVDWYDQQDFDRDGFKGTDDWCPDIAGIKATQNPDSGHDGCPAEVDTDKDGVGDFRDRCPGTSEEDAKKYIVGDGQSDFGWASEFTAHDGCVDSDGDGVADTVDLCPDSNGEVGDYATNGCDPIQLAAKTCKATLSSTPDKGEGDVELATGKVLYGDCTYDDKATSIECGYNAVGLTDCSLKG